MMKYRQEKLNDWWLRSLLVMLFLITSCIDEKQEDTTNQEGTTHNKADGVIDRVFAAHGTDHLLNGNAYFFQFRNKKYSFQKTPEGLLYESYYMVDNKSIRVRLLGHQFSYYVDGQKTSLPLEEEDKEKKSLNSVIYFATLPLKLRDEGVQWEMLDEVKYNGTTYLPIYISFQEEGGGQDYQDEFVYWINKSTYYIDYFAYLYHTNKGGIRFRRALNQRFVEGVRFQDYINLKPQNRVLNLAFLQSLLHKQDELIPVSSIITEQITVTHSKTMNK